MLVGTGQDDPRIPHVDLLDNPYPPSGYRFLRGLGRGMPKNTWGWPVTDMHLQWLFLVWFIKLAPYVSLIVPRTTFKSFLLCVWNVELIFLVLFDRWYPLHPSRSSEYCTMDVLLNSKSGRMTCCLLATNANHQLETITGRRWSLRTCKRKQSPIRKW